MTLWNHPQPVRPIEAAQDAGPHDPSDVAQLAAIVDKFASLPGLLRQSVTDELWASIPYHVTEEAHNPALPIGAALAAPPMTQGLELIETIIVSVPAGATGVVVLGSSTLYVPASGLFSIGGLHMLLDGTAVRTLTLAGAAGPASLMLTGMMQPTYGQSPT